MKKLNKKELAYFDNLTKDRFMDQETSKVECMIILKMRRKLGLDNEELIRDFKEYFNEDY